MAPLLAQKSRVDRNFERLYRRHAVDVYRYAFAVLRNQPDAEDVTQTTFMNAYRALERGETPQTPHNWLIAIAHNVCRQRFRQASRRPLEIGLEEDVADQFVAPEDDNAPAPEDIRRALQHLAFNQRAALVMRDLEGRSYAEIADLLDLSVSAVETLIFRARRALREQLESALTCGQAEQAISRQLDGALPRAERSQLRAHLRECVACRRIARSQRAQRSALRGALGAVPLPSSFGSLFGGGGVAVAAKAAAVVVATGVATGVGVDVHHRLAPPAKHRRTPPVRPAAAKPAVPPDAPVVAAVVPRAQSSRQPASPATTRVRGRAPRLHRVKHPLTPAARVTAETPPSAKVAHAPAAPAAAAVTHGRGAGNGSPTGRTHGQAHSGASPPAQPTRDRGQGLTHRQRQNHGQGRGQGQGRGRPSNGHGNQATLPLVPPVTTVPTPVPGRGKHGDR